MPKAYSMDIRQRVVDACERGMKRRDVAERYEVSENWVYKLLRQRRETGSIEPLKTKRGPKPKLAPHMDRLAELVAEYPDATLAEHAEMLPIAVGKSSVWRALKLLNITVKKSL